ncbi:uncharacterized protein N7498_005182 [Penicillium cinerascens]|uniref:Beta-galactosidase domain-containing protein n=1 Tax=Penicillium cinerascens TaxID=70096 RepID=A0A9W9SZW4_9EURO|nr:uncharacterized protein N7498_005182 [Penicillium cinerascens]KAJ5204303.1 hypothetical protein N7498_005182 [Penicillium cinerascens]
MSWSDVWKAEPFKCKPDLIQPVDAWHYSPAITEEQDSVSPTYSTARFLRDSGVDCIDSASCKWHRDQSYLIRHADFSSLENTQYTITVPTSQGNVIIPQLGGKLSFNDRDSKFHVADYDLGRMNLVYSSAEIFTWARGAGLTRLVILYGDACEMHELALSRHIGNPSVVKGSNVTIRQMNATCVIQWAVSPIAVHLDT